MAGSSSNFPIPILSGENFGDWSKKMKIYLNSLELWALVEEGCGQKPSSIEGVDIDELKEKRADDAKALSLIHRFISPKIFLTIFDAKTAKEAWDALHAMFQVNDSAHSSRTKNIKELGPVSEDESSDDEPMDGSISSSSDDDEPFTALGAENFALLGDKPFFDVILTKCALKPLYQMHFPLRVNSMLPDTNLKATVRCLGETHEILFYGHQKIKRFGAGWRQFVDEYDLVEDDALVFEIIESTDSKLEFKIHILRCALPHELEDEIKKRNAKTKIIIDDDGDDDDDDDS